MEDIDPARAALRRPRIGHPADAPDDHDAPPLERRRRRIIDNDGAGAPIAHATRMDPVAGAVAAVMRTAVLAAPQEPARAAFVMDNDVGCNASAVVVAIAATLAHLVPSVMRLTMRPLGPFGEAVDLFAVGRVVMATPDSAITLALVERTRRDARTVAGVTPAHCVQGEWEWDPAAGAFALARGTMAWATEVAETTRHVPAVVAHALAAAIRRGDPSMHGVAVQVDSAGGAVWRPVVHNLPVALTARQAWGMSRPHDWDTYRAALDAALELLRPVSWCEETWLLAPQAHDPRIRTVEERGRRAWIDADGEPRGAVRLSRNARAILVARGLLPARDEA